MPSSSVGNNKTWIDQAERVILEVNSWQPAALEGMHDIYYGLRAAAESPTDSTRASRPAHRHALSPSSRGEGRRHRAHGFSRPQ